MNWFCKILGHKRYNRDELFCARCKEWVGDPPPVLKVKGGYVVIIETQGSGESPPPKQGARAGQ